MNRERSKLKKLEARQSQLEGEASAHKRYVDEQKEVFRRLQKGEPK